MTDYPTGNTSGTRTGSARLIVLHSTETPHDTARAVARNFQDTSRPASAHWIIGTDGAFSGVPESDVAWAAPGANHDGIQIEQCGYAYKTDWGSGVGAEVVAATAQVVAGISQRWGIPLRHLSNAELASGAWGVVTHAQVSEVYRRSDHTDPGPSYPVEAMLAMAGSGGASARTAPDGAELLAVDGDWGPATGARFREVFGLPATAPWEDACRAFQYFLSWTLDAYQIHEATGDAWTVERDGVDGPITVKGFQAWWNSCGVPEGSRIDVDGEWGPDTYGAMQIALNHSSRGTRALACRG